MDELTSEQIEELCKRAKRGPNNYAAINALRDMALRALSSVPREPTEELARARAALRDAADGVGIDREGDTHDWETKHAAALTAAKE